MLENARLYNKSDTLVHKSAIRLTELVAPILAELDTLDQPGTEDYERMETMVQSLTEETVNDLFEYKLCEIEDEPIPSPAPLIIATLPAASALPALPAVIAPTLPVPTPAPKPKSSKASIKKKRDATTAALDLPAVKASPVVVPVLKALLAMNPTPGPSIPKYSFASRLPGVVTTPAQKKPRSGGLKTEAPSLMKGELLPVPKSTVRKPRPAKPRITKEEKLPIIAAPLNAIASSSSFPPPPAVVSSAAALNNVVRAQVPDIIIDKQASFKLFETG